MAGFPTRQVPFLAFSACLSIFLLLRLEKNLSGSFLYSPLYICLESSLAHQHFYRNICLLDYVGFYIELPLSLVIVLLIYLVNSYWIFIFIYFFYLLLSPQDLKINTHGLSVLMECVVF